MKRITFISFFISLALYLSGQVQVGVQLESGMTTLRDISEEEIVPFGLSGATFEVSLNTYVYPSLMVRSSIGPKLYFRSGIGYSKNSFDIDLLYVQPQGGIRHNPTLSIDLAYISIPVGIDWTISTFRSWSLLLSLELTANQLVSSPDNFEEIIRERIGWVDRKSYANFLLTSSASLGLQKVLSERSLLALSVSYTTSISSLTNKDNSWGFFLNMDSSRMERTGFRLTYLRTLGV